MPVLLGMADDGAIPGSLAGAVAWIAALDPDLADGLPESNALALVKTGMEFPSHAYRAAIVGKILAARRPGMRILCPARTCERWRILTWHHSLRITSPGA